VGNRVGVRVAWWLLLVAVCTHFCLAYVQNYQPFLNLNDYIHGKARVPYQHRALMAWVLRLGLQVPRLAVLSSHLPGPLRDPRIFILFLTSWISIFGSVIFTWGSLSQLVPNEQYSRWASLLVVYMAYFHFPLVFGFNFLLPYDLPSLFFFCGCLYCVITGRMFFFYLLFVVGAFNRETICMTTVFLMIWRWEEREDRGRRILLAGHILAQGAIWIAIKLYLHHLFAANVAEVPNASLHYKLGYNMRTIVELQQWPVLLSVFGFTLPVVLAWREWMKHPAMERAIYLLAVWFVVMMMVGVIIEIRIFSELISYMSLAVALIAYNRFSARQGQ
jgi:hypothetical protein